MSQDDCQRQPRGALPEPPPLGAQTSKGRWPGDRRKYQEVEHRDQTQAEAEPVLPEPLQAVVGPHGDEGDQGVKHGHADRGQAERTPQSVEAQAAYAHAMQRTDGQRGAEAKDRR